MHEPISVYSIFHNGSIKPLSFMWKKRRISVENITYSWETIEESGVNMHFSIVSGNFYYHLVYIPAFSRWYICDVESTVV